VISEEANGSIHRKHAKLKRPQRGEFGRSEIALLGTNCTNIRSLAYNIISRFSANLNIAYVDADHKNIDEDSVAETSLSIGAALEYTDKIGFQRIDFDKQPNRFQRLDLFNQQDLVLVNGNHFTAQTQIVIIDPAKSIEKKLDRLTNVQLIILLENTTVPPYITNHLNGQNIPVCQINDGDAISAFLQSFLKQQMSPLKALILAGGKSTRMKTDKGSLNYHGTTQREYLYNLLSKHCDTYVSCNHDQALELEADFKIIEDTFLNLGPVGGILSALQSDPDSAWLTVACDLPYLSDKTIRYLVNNRNPYKTATAFRDVNGALPEPLITIWEPRSYTVLLQFLAQGYSCPRKVLINADIHLLHAPDASEFENVNFPDQYQQALQQINNHKK
jgi:molybdopterin-guanine dinucleotide biosynthesis protein A